MRRPVKTLLIAALAAAVIATTTGATPAPASASASATTWPAVAGLPDPARASPAQVTSFFKGLSPERRAELARAHPGAVGNLDGAPPALRYAANARAVRADGRFPHLAGRQVLAFDPRGRGRAVLVHGDLETARHVAVVVPGADTDAAQLGPLDAAARHLHAAAGPGTAVLAWAGYTTPVGVGLDAATGSLAETGARHLARLTAGLAATGTPATSVFCHSYGSVVCGLAAHRLDVSDLVVAGSPGMRAPDAAALCSGARVWAARDDEDWIGWIPNVRVADLGHGADPAAPAFGARRVPTAEVHGHSGYFTPGTASLRTFAAIARGDVR